MARRQAGGDLGRQHPNRGKAEEDIRIWMSLFLSPETCKLLLLILPGTHIQVKFRDHYVVWHWSDFEREEKFAFCWLHSLCSLDLGCLNWSPPAIKNKKIQQQCPSSSCTIFLIYMSFLFPFPACFLLTCLPFFLPSLSPSFPSAFLPLFHKHLSNSQVYVHDKGTIKFHGNRFISWSSPRAGGPHLEFKRTACFSFGWFSQAEFRSSRFPNFKTQ